MDSKLNIDAATVSTKTTWWLYKALHFSFQMRLEKALKFFLLLFNYSYPYSPPHYSLCPAHLPSHIQSSPLSLPVGPLYMSFDLTLPLLSPVSPLPPPLWSLSVCSLHERQLSLGSKKNSKLGVYNGLDVTGFSRFDFHLQVFVLNGNVNVIKAKFFVSTFPCNKQGGHSV